MRNPADSRCRQRSVKCEYNAYAALRHTPSGILHYPLPFPILAAASLLFATLRDPRDLAWNLIENIYYYAYLIVHYTTSHSSPLSSCRSTYASPRRASWTRSIATPRDVHARTYQGKFTELQKRLIFLSLSLAGRQKHSQTSLQILDDVYYREAVPISSQSSKEKEHSILRRHADMSQTQLCDDGESSSTATATHEMLTKAAIASVPASACDMGCQTRYTRGRVINISRPLS